MLIVFSSDPLATIPLDDLLKSSRSDPFEVFALALAAKLSNETQPSLRVPVGER